MALLVIRGIVTSDCTAAEPLTYSEVVKKTTRTIDRGMEIYAGPPTIPRPKSEFRSPEALKWSSDVLAVRLAALERMDDAVMIMITEGFERKMSLKSIQTRTADCLNWVEWPMSYDSRHGEPRGIHDHDLTHEEWSSPANGVVVIHQAHRTPSGLELHYLQNTFRSWRGKDTPGYRVSFSAYVIILKDNAVRREKLFGSLNGLTIDVKPPRLLGFVVSSENDMPDIAMYRGPFDFGPYIELASYLWMDRDGSWEEIGSLEAISPAAYVSYDPGTTELKCFKNRDVVASTYALKEIFADGKNVVTDEEK